MRLYGLIGYPLGHSFSKAFFTKKFDAENIKDCSYELFPITNINQLPGLLEANPQLRGFNITIPYKRDILQFLNDSYIPGQLQACNCVSISSGRLAGYNTDIVGFEKSFLEKWRPWQSAALVLGNGGAAAAVKYVLRKLEINFRVVGRSLSQDVDMLYSQLDKQTINNHPVIINCTPLGTSPEVALFPPIPYQFVGAGHYLFDLVYNPAETVFLRKGTEQGATTENGYNMLVYQAEEAWRIWNI